MTVYLVTYLRNKIRISKQKKNMCQKSKKGVQRPLKMNEIDTKNLSKIKIAPQYFAKYKNYV